MENIDIQVLSTIWLFTLNKTSHLIKLKKTDNDFKDYKFSASSLPEFTSFQTKIVFKGTNSSYTARLKDFRAVALAI